MKTRIPIGAILLLLAVVLVTVLVIYLNRPIEDVGIARFPGTV